LFNSLLQKGVVILENNMLRDRAKGIDNVTDAMWEQVCEHNREMVQEYLDSNKHLSKQSIKQYTSALRIFFYYICTHLKNKPLYEVKKRDFIKYFSWLQEYNLSSSSLKFKKSSVSSLCNFIENIIAEDEEDYKNFRNFTTAIKDIPSNKVYSKVPITEVEYNILIEELLKRKNYLACAWVATSWNVGSRRNETVQFKAEIPDYNIKEGKNYVDSHIVYAKGRSGGKPVNYMINKEALKYMKLWIEKRGYNHEYIFTTKYKGEINVASEGWSDDLCKNILSKILDRRINVHLFKSSCITNLLEKGVDIKTVSKYVAQHESTETTAIYDLRDDTEAKDNIF